jgi:hypothetical protein
MGWVVHVQLKGGKTEVESPQFETREEAEAEIAKIKAVIGGISAPDVSWMTASGDDILGAHIKERHAPFIG